MSIGQKSLINKMDESFNIDIDCKFVKITSNDFKELEINKNKTTRRNDYKTYCICKKYYFENGFLLTKQISQCYQWVINYNTYYILTAVLIIVFPLINSLFILVLRLFITFERIKFLSQEMIGNTLKIFIFQFINMV